MMCRCGGISAHKKPLHSTHPPSTDSILLSDNFYLNHLLALPTFKHTVNFDLSLSFKIVSPVFASCKGDTNISTLNSSNRLPNFSTNVAEVQDRVDLTYDANFNITILVSKGMAKGLRSVGIFQVLIAYCLSRPCFWP